MFFSFQLISLMKNNAPVALRHLRAVPGAIDCLLAAAAEVCVLGGDADNSAAESDAETSRTPFCHCGRCSHRSLRQVERRCCRRTPGMCVLQSDDVVDIFRDVVVRTAVSADRNALCEDRWEFSNNVLRHQAYRQFVYLVGGNVGMRKRLIVPSCVTWYIRDRWPSSDGVYTGFKAATGAQAAILTWRQEEGVNRFAGHDAADELEETDSE
jgi:hypothetical protein